MSLLLDSDLEQLVANGRTRIETGESDFFPVVKLFGGPCTWLLTDVEPDNPTIAFGLCDLGQGFPELGSVWLEEIASLPNLLIERDEHFEATAKISVYAQKAREARQIVEDV